MEAPSPDAQWAEALGEHVSGRPERVAAVLLELADLLERTWAAGDDDALDAVVCALGQTSGVRAAALLMLLARAGHRDPGVRTSLAWALGGTGVDAEPVRSQVVAALVTLSADPVDDVRDRACSALGSDEADDEDEHTAALDLALRRCRPDAAASARRVEAGLADASVRRRRAGLPCGRLEGSWPRTVVVDLDGDGALLEGQVPSARGRPTTIPPAPTSTRWSRPS